MISLISLCLSCYSCSCNWKWMLYDPFFLSLVHSLSMTQLLSQGLISNRPRQRVRFLFSPCILHAQNRYSSSVCFHCAMGLSSVGLGSVFLLSFTPGVTFLSQVSPLCTGLCVPCSFSRQTVVPASSATSRASALSLSSSSAKISQLILLPCHSSLCSLASGRACCCFLFNG